MCLFARPPPRSRATRPRHVPGQPQSPRAFFSGSVGRCEGETHTSAMARRGSVVRTQTLANPQKHNISNFKAEELFEILYKGDEDVDRGTLDTRTLASALTQKPAPTLRRGPQVSGGAQWTDEGWLRRQLSTMDLRLESRSIQTSRPSAFLGELPRADDDAPPKDDESEAPCLTDAQKRQAKAMMRLTVKSAGVLKKTKHALHARHTLVQYPPMRQVFLKLGYAAITFKSGGADGAYARRAGRPSRLTRRLCRTFKRAALACRRRKNQPKRSSSRRARSAQVRASVELRGHVAHALRHLPQTGL